MKLHEQIPDQLPTADPGSERNTRMGRNLMNFSGGIKAAAVGCILLLGMILWGWHLSEQGYTSENIKTGGPQAAPETREPQEPVKY